MVVPTPSSVPPIPYVFSSCSLVYACAQMPRPAQAPACVPRLRLRQSYLCTLLVSATRRKNTVSAVDCCVNQSVRTHHRHTAGCLSFHHMAQCVVHALKGLACRARVTPASSPASHCKQCSALTSLRSTRAAAQVLIAHADVTKNTTYFSMGPKLRHSGGTLPKRPPNMLRALAALAASASTASLYAARSALQSTQTINAAADGEAQTTTVETRCVLGRGKLR